MKCRVYAGGRCRGAAGVKKIGGGGGVLFMVLMDK